MLRQKEMTVQEDKLLHNYAAIIRDADTPINTSSMKKLYDQLYAGLLLKGKTKKFWIKKMFINCFMLLARDLSITWSEDNRYWRWLNLQGTSNEFVNAAELLDVCWLELCGKFETAKLTPGVLYRVTFVVMMKDPSYGWEVPENVRLVLPDGSTQEHKENLMEKPKGKWIEIPVGQFWASSDNAGEIKFSLFEHGGQWKRGLIVKGVIIQPQNKAVKCSTILSNIQSNWF